MARRQYIANDFDAINKRLQEMNQKTIGNIDFLIRKNDRRSFDWKPVSNRSIEWMAVFFPRKPQDEGWYCGMSRDPRVKGEVDWSNPGWRRIETFIFVEE